MGKDVFDIVQINWLFLTMTMSFYFLSVLILKIKDFLGSSLTIKTKSISNDFVSHQVPFYTQSRSSLLHFVLSKHFSKLISDVEELNVLERG